MVAISEHSHSKNEMNLEELEPQLCLGEDVHSSEVADDLQALRQLDRGSASREKVLSY